jgi:hypothetical protein
MHVTIKRRFHVTESLVNRSIRLISSRTLCVFCCINGVLHRSQWLRGVRQRPSALRFLVLQLRIPPGTWMSVSCEFISSWGLSVGLITHPEDSYQVWCVWVWLWKPKIAMAVPHCGMCTPTSLWIWDRQSVSKRPHIKFRRRGITQKKTYITRRKFEIKCRSSRSVGFFHWSQ